MITNLSEKMRPVLHNNSLVVKVLQSGGDLEDAIIALHEANEVQFHRIIELAQIAPRKYKMKDGTVLVWRCPDDMIPETLTEGPQP